MRKSQLKIGDVFVVPLTDVCRYFQYVAIDESQLRSDVIRVFSRTFALSDQPDIDNLVSEPIDFYAHCVIRVGLKGKQWSKVGHINDIGKTDVLFRSTKDFGRHWIKTSERWEVWQISQPRKFVGKLSARLALTDHGEVFPPYEIIHRMLYGQYKQSFHS